jgi:putative Mg2+ transporter-C (MgtC) family protein
MLSEFESLRSGEALTHLIRLFIAYVFALPMAFNRERDDRGAGLRTFPLVAVGACGYMLIGIEVLDTPDAHSRVVYGIITGIGFIGGGAILKSSGGVHGTATAASIWNVGALGVAVAWQRYDIAVILCVVNFLTLVAGARLKTFVQKSEHAEVTPERGEGKRSEER